MHELGLIAQLASAADGANSRGVTVFVVVNDQFLQTNLNNVRFSRRNGNANFKTHADGWDQVRGGRELLRGYRS